ncbi:glycoside hydrolase family 25 protein [Amycolatopsis thermophila]|uniref:GH25 family lysozyme M1 (1,4-beta-N-acetylmuramidase) n=1 Tax=Amycolatopsis thermophila TaxID=206084 RepID=A0ABU0ERN3_9PSEU|nr:glycoside hydrolase family 25 protein [Amycolatopsis thermophila]MDQ0377956.1 GH25 family lysozyme M1 (1,4-beta-N-acetylmuramidase) [Amycolatopsis thermophila]
MAVITFGLDQSHHQDRRVNLSQARRDGVEFCIHKAGQGGFMVDDDFAYNLAIAENVGMLNAAYWFIDSRSTAQQHIDLIVKTVPKRVPIIPDVESIKDNQGRIVSAPSLELTWAVINGLRRLGYVVPIIYLPKWYWQTWGSPSLVGLPPLWSSRYPDMQVGTLAEEWADVPAHYWDGYGGLGVAILQFTSSGRVAGYQPLDLNAFRGSRDDLARLLGLGGGASVVPSATPVEDDVQKDLPAGERMFVRLFMAGKPHFFWWEINDSKPDGTPHQGEILDVAYIKRTPLNSDKPDYGRVGDHGYPDLRGTFHKDRPGPIQIADDVAFMRLIVSCTGESTMGVG